jgi:hypothetical protein
MLMRRTFLIAVLLLAGCTGGNETLLSPAPTTCPHGIVRAESAPVEELDVVMQGHVPGDLPEGFGIAEVWGPGDGMVASATWTDGRCREVTVGLGKRVAFPQGVPIDGGWFVTVDAPGDCGNAVLGTGRCLRYMAIVDGGTVSVSMIGLDRVEADPIVVSIPT